jgi:hypothetical protein
MAKETKEERRARIQEEVAARAEARTKTYFENVEKAKAAAAAQAPELPASDAYNYDYAWRSAVGSKSTDERTTATQSMWSGPTTFTGSSSGAGSSGSVVKDPYAGLTPEQIDARKNAEAIAKQYGLSIDPATGMIIKPPANYVIDPVTGKFVDPSKVSKPGKIETRRVTNPDGSITIFYNDGTTATIPARVVTGSGNGFSGSSATGFSSSGAPTGPTLAKDVFKQTLALFFGESELTKGWMDELYNVVSKYYRNGVAVAEALNMSLLDARNNPNLKAFTDRFKGIYALQDLRQAGKPVNVPTIAEYVAAQAGMADILNQAGLGELGSEQFTGELIGKGNSVSTVADKIGNVYQRIDMAPKEIKDVLGRYFPTVDKPTLAKTILLGEKGVTQLVDELNKYDVLAAAEQQGVGALGAKGILGGVTEDRAQNYARLGYSYSEILPKFGQVREVTPTVGKLAGISKAADIGQVGVEQALISGLAQPMETIKKLGEEEIGRFSGKAGRAELGLASQRRANRAF